MKRSRTLKMVSNIQRKKIALNVRRDGPQSSIFVRTFSAITTWHYGYEISQRTGLKSGTLYPILIRLAEQGWLETRWAEPERQGRPARHTYRLTQVGSRAAAALATRGQEEVSVRRPDAQGATG